MQNEELQKNVQDALNWEPSVKGAEIGVTAINGIVTLSGSVDSYAKKMEAEKVVKHVRGVKAIIEKIEVQVSGLDKNGDSNIAKDVLRALKSNVSIPDEKISLTVENGWITLEGELEWNYQKEAVHAVIYYLEGVKGIKNYLKIKTDLENTVEKKDIERAMLRNWSIDSRNVSVNVEGDKIILKGSVSSLYQKEQVGKIASNAPGVAWVENELLVEHI